MFEELNRWRRRYPVLVMSAITVRRRGGRNYSHDLALLWSGHDRVLRALDALATAPDPRRWTEAQLAVEAAWKELETSTAALTRRIQRD